MKGLGRLLRLLLPHWRMVLLGTFLSLLALAANMGLLALSSWFIASMAIAGSLGAAMDYATPGAAVRGLALLRAGGRYAERLANHDATLRILSSLRVWFFRRIEPLAPARLAAHRSGDLLSRIRSDVDTLDDFYVRGVVPAIVAVLAVAAVAPVLARFDLRLMLIDVVGLACAGVLLPLLLRALAEGPGRERVAHLASLRASIVEEVQGMAELISLGAIDGHAAGIRAVGNDLDRQERRLSSLQGVGEAGLVAMSSLALWAAAYLLVPAVAGGSLPPAHLAMLTVLILASFEAVTPLPAVIQRAGEMAAAARRLFELIDAPPAVVEPTSSAASSAKAEAAARSPALGISIRDLRFRYAPDERWVIDRLSLAVAPGRRLAVVGPTGIGKSTLVSILMRFWDYEAGEILVEGPDLPAVDLRVFSGAQARRLFSVMPQAPHLFHATLRENLQLASPDDTSFEERSMVEALQAALLGDFLAALPEGLDTTVGETGRALSMGELRRVALARAFLKEAPVYLLDEPTESLDEPTADALLEEIDRRLAGRTLVVITHRPRDLALADQVVRLGPD